MALDYPNFLLNFKIYEGTAGTDGLALAKTIEAVAKATDGTFVVAPQTPDIERIGRQTSLPVVAQSVDSVRPGRGNGRISLPAVEAAGADGVLINHPESQSTLSETTELIAGCAKRDLESIVCVDSIEMGRAVLAFDPDCLLFENPEDIATEQSMTETHPERIEEFVAMVAEVNPQTSVLLGGGVSTGTDVRRALELGADGAGAASAFIDASDKDGWLSSIAESLVEQ